MLYTARNVKAAFSLKVRFMRFFRRVKTGLSQDSSVRHNLHPPFSLVRGYAQKTYFIGFSSLTNVLKVFRARNLAKICKSIINFITVNMVNVLCRPFSGNVKPRQPMREMLPIVYGYRPIPHSLLGASNAAYKVWPTTVRNPNKNAGKRVVAQNFPKVFNSAWWTRFHDSVFTIRGEA